MPAGYQVKLQTVCGHGADLRILSLLDRAQFSDPEGQAEAAGISSAAWPLFGQLWSSGHVLANVMQSFELEGKHILELGCGLALASLVIHRRGGDITASDCHPLAAAFLLENLKLNHLPAMKYQQGNWSAANPALGKFNLIIGSDVLYDRDQPQALSQFIDAHSSACVEVLIVDPDRGNRSSFSQRMAALGYSHSQSRVATLAGRDASYKGRILSYRRGTRPAS